MLLGIACGRFALGSRSITQCIIKLETWWW